ncbi:hypothetical protein QE152_g37524 [Popillia japonica]|uniref:Uncharacterized protein n=1 Tax=Popillia japonica TaxID=7064 RepID=A0AAW1I9I4_POPJA
MLGRCVRDSGCLGQACHGAEPSAVDKRDVLKGHTRCCGIPKILNRHLNKSQGEDCWREISAKMQCPVSELKWNRWVLIGERRVEKKSHITGSGAADVYRSKWFGYPYFDVMRTKNEVGATQDTMPIVSVLCEPKMNRFTNSDEYQMLVCFILCGRNDELAAEMYFDRYPVEEMMNWLQKCISIDTLTDDSQKKAFFADCVII